MGKDFLYITQITQGTEAKLNDGTTSNLKVSLQQREHQ